MSVSALPLGVPATIISVISLSLSGVFIFLLEGVVLGFSNVAWAPNLAILDNIMHEGNF